MASHDSTRRPSSGRWIPPPKGPWSPALNAITPHNTTQGRSVMKINDGSSSSTIPASSGLPPNDPHFEQQTSCRAPQQLSKKRCREPNLDIGVLQPIPSTECSGLPLATGITLTSGITIRCGHGEELDPTKLSPSSFAVPNWDELGSVVEMQRQGWEGFQEWLQHSVLLGRARRWKKNYKCCNPSDGLLQRIYSIRCSVLCPRPWHWLSRHGIHQLLCTNRHFVCTAPTRLTLPKIAGFWKKGTEKKKKKGGGDSLWIEVPSFLFSFIEYLSLFRSLKTLPA